MQMPTRRHLRPPPRGHQGFQSCVARFDSEGGYYYYETLVNVEVRPFNSSAVVWKVLHEFTEELNDVRQKNPVESEGEDVCR